MPIKIAKEVLFAIVAQNKDIPIEEVNEETTIPQDTEFSSTRVCIEIDLEDVLKISNLTIKHTVTNVGELIKMLQGMDNYEN